MSNKLFKIKNGLNLKPQPNPPANPAEGDYYQDDGTNREKGLYGFKDGVWEIAGTGAGGAGLKTFATENFEKFKVTDLQEQGNGAYGSGGSINGVVSIEDVTPIDGTQSLKYTAGAASTNDYFIVSEVSVSPLQKSVASSRSIWIDASNFSVDFDIIVYDETNLAVINTQTVIGGTGLKEYIVQLNLSDTTNLISYGLSFPNAPVNTEYVIIDNVEFSVDPFMYADINEENVFSARIDGESATLDANRVLSQNANFIDTVTRTATGNYVVTFINNFFSEIPSLSGAPFDDLTSSGGVSVRLEDVTSSGAIVRLLSTTANVDESFTLNAIRQGADYKQPTQNVVTPAKSNMFDTKIVQGITIEATTTNPTKSSNMEVDEIQYEQRGNKGFFKYVYRTDSTVSGAINGNGDYLYSLPNGLEFDDAIVDFFTGLVGTTNSDDLPWRTYGFVSGVLDGVVRIRDGGIIPYDATRFRIIYTDNGEAFRFINSSHFQTNLVNTGYSVEFQVPIKGWSSETQFLSLIETRNEVSEITGELDAYYREDFESFIISDIFDSGNNATYSTGGVPIDGTLSMNSTTPINKLQSLKYSAGATSLDDWFTVATQAVFPKQKVNQNALSIWIDASGFSTNFDIVVYDETNSNIIETLTVNGGTQLKKYIVQFSVPVSCSLISYGFAINNVPVNGETFDIGDAQLTTDPFVYKDLLTTQYAYIIDGTSVPASSDVTQSPDFDTDNGLWTESGGVYTFLRDCKIEAYMSVSTAQSLARVIINGTARSSQRAPANSIASASFNGLVSKDDQLYFSNGTTLASTGAVQVGLTAQAESQNVVTPAKSNMFDTKIVQGITIEATTTNPTKGTTSFDQIQYSQVGDKGVFKFEFEQTTAGSAGSGDYLYSLPDNLEFADDVLKSTVGTGSVDTLAPAFITGGFMNVSGTNAGGSVYIMPYDSTRFRVIVQDYFATSLIHDSAYFSFANVGLRFGFNFQVPIKGWSSKAQFLAAIPVQQTAYLKDEKPSGTNSQTLTAGIYNTINLTTKTGSLSSVSLNADQITFNENGIYKFNADIPMCGSGGNIGTAKSRLQGITDTGFSVYGGNARASGSSTITIQSLIKTEIVVTNAPQTFEVQVIPQSGGGNVGAIGLAGVVETYTQVEITKIK